MKKTVSHNVTNTDVLMYRSCMTPFHNETTDDTLKQFTGFSVHGKDQDGRSVRVPVTYDVDDILAGKPIKVSCHRGYDEVWKPVSTSLIEVVRDDSNTFTHNGEMPESCSGCPLKDLQNESNCAVTELLGSTVVWNRLSKIQDER